MIKQIKHWIFIAESFERSSAFELFPHIPFIGSYLQAEQEAMKRRDVWEAQYDEFICRLIIQEASFHQRNQYI